MNNRGCGMPSLRYHLHLPPNVIIYGDENLGLKNGLRVWYPVFFFVLAQIVICCHLFFLPNPPLYSSLCIIAKLIFQRLIFWTFLFNNIQLTPFCLCNIFLALGLEFKAIHIIVLFISFILSHAPVMIPSLLEICFTWFFTCSFLTPSFAPSGLPECKILYSSQGVISNSFQPSGGG